MIFVLIFVAALVVFGLVPVALLVLARSALGEGHKRKAGAAAAMALLVWMIALDTFVVEPHALEVSTFEIESPRIDRPLRIAVLADIQTDAPGEYEREVFAEVAKAEPDLILFPGDFVQVAGPSYAQQTELLNALLRDAGWMPPLGAYAVDGNVEVIHDDWTRIFEGTEVVAWTQRTRRDLGPLVLTGLPMHESFNAGLRLPREAGFHLVFGHAPDFALGDMQADLMIAGHTHGGQVRLPFIGPLITFSNVPRDWAAGHTELEDGRHLVVSRGIGMERGPAPRMRFLCRPQLVLIDLKPA